MDRVRLRVNGKACAGGQQEVGRHADSKFMRAARVKVTIKKRERSNTAAMIEGWKTVS